MHHWHQTRTKDLSKQSKLRKGRDIPAARFVSNFFVKMNTMKSTSFYAPMSLDLSHSFDTNRNHTYAFKSKASTSLSNFVPTIVKPFDSPYALYATPL